MRRIIACCLARRLILAGAAVLTGAMLFFGYSVLGLGHFDEQWRFASVQPGMSEAEALAVIGKPPGQYGPPGAKYGRSMWLG